MKIYFEKRYFRIWLLLIVGFCIVWFMQGFLTAVGVLFVSIATSQDIRP